MATLGRLRPVQSRRSPTQDSIGMYWAYPKEGEACDDTET